MFIYDEGLSIYIYIHIYIIYTLTSYNNTTAFPKLSAFSEIFINNRGHTTYVYYLHIYRSRNIA